MMKPPRALILLGAVLAAACLIAALLLLDKLPPYLIAKYRGRGAALVGAALPSAPLAGADLEGANLERANLRGADLRGARLRGANLARADLRGADMTGAQLVWPAMLRRAQIVQQRLATARQAALSSPEGARRSPRVWMLAGGLQHYRALSTVSLEGALYDEHTRWPAGFDPRAHRTVAQE